MQQIKQYHRLNDLKPDYHRLRIPYFVPSKPRIALNLKELELYYSREFGVYMPKRDRNEKIGGGDTRTQVQVMPPYW